MNDIKEPTIDDDLATVAAWLAGGVSMINRQDVAVRLAIEIVRLRAEFTLRQAVHSWVAIQPELSVHPKNDDYQPPEE